MAAEPVLYFGLESVAFSWNRFPAKAGAQPRRPCRWTPAFAGEQVLQLKPDRP